MHRTNQRFWQCFNNYRALAFKDGEDYIWVWIRSHEQYDGLLK